MTIAMIWHGAGPRTHSMTWESAARTIYQRFGLDGPWSVWELHDSPDNGGQWSRCPESVDLPGAAELLTPTQALRLAPEVALEADGLLVRQPLNDTGQTLHDIGFGPPQSRLRMVDVPRGALVPVGAVVAKKCDCGLTVGFAAD